MEHFLLLKKCQLIIPAFRWATNSFTRIYTIIYLPPLVRIPVTPNRSKGRGEKKLVSHLHVVFVIASILHTNPLSGPSYPDGLPCSDTVPCKHLRPARWLKIASPILTWRGPIFHSPPRHHTPAACQPSPHGALASMLPPPQNRSPAWRLTDTTVIVRAELAVKN